MKLNVDTLHHARGMVDIRIVERLAGQLSWASGLFPWIKCFNAALWASITAHKSEEPLAKFSARKRPTQLFFIQRIAQAVAWTILLLGGLLRTPGGQLQLRRLSTSSSRSWSVIVCIRTDASPFGFGAILFIKWKPMAWIAGPWTAEDLDRLKATYGSPAWQAEWELYAAMLAIDRWLPMLRGRPLALIQMDATAALHAISRLSGRTPAMNAVAAEIALRLETAGVEMAPEHVTGTMNFQCDALSRLTEQKKVPTILHGVRRDEVRPRVPSFFWSWPG